MKGTGITRLSLPEKPYLWRGNPGLAEVNERLMAEREGRLVMAPVQYFSFPMPLPGPPHQAGRKHADAQAEASRRDTAA